MKRWGYMYIPKREVGMMALNNVPRYASNIRWPRGRYAAVVCSSDLFESAWGEEGNGTQFRQSLPSHKE